MEQQVKMSFTVPVTVKERLRRYSQWAGFSMNDVFKMMVSELRIDSYNTNQKNISESALRTQLFLGLPDVTIEKPTRIVSDTDGRNNEIKKISFWRRFSLINH